MVAIVLAMNVMVTVFSSSPWSFVVVVVGQELGQELLYLAGTRSIVWILLPTHFHRFQHGLYVRIFRLSNIAVNVDMRAVAVLDQLLDLPVPIFKFHIIKGPVTRDDGVDQIAKTK